MASGSTIMSVMSAQTGQRNSWAAGKTRPWRVGCVSFLNAKPLIEGLDAIGGVDVRYDVPSQLLEDLENGEVDLALCPAIDFQRSKVPLRIVPCGGIGCEGTTLTVRLFSQLPLDQITAVHADTDSHTSVVLLQVLLHELHRVRPKVIHFDARAWESSGAERTWPPAMLLIGDKVVTDSPPAVRYPHQMDLGHAWRELTGLPFVFAVWMTRTETELGDLPAVLTEVRLANVTRIGQIVARHAAAHGWPEDLASAYLGHWLKYDIGEPQLQAMERFYALAQGIGLVKEVRVIEATAPLAPRPHPTARSATGAERRGARLTGDHGATHQG